MPLFFYFGTAFMLFNCDAFDVWAVNNPYGLKVVESRASLYQFYLTGLYS